MDTNYRDYTPEIDYNDAPPVISTSGTKIPDTVKSTKTGVRKKKNSKKEQPKPSKGVAAQKDESIVDIIKAFAANRTLCTIVGTLLGLLGVYLLVSFISYITTCVHDQSLINNIPIGSSAPVANKGGEGGARISEFLINESFGLGSFVIILWLLAMSVKLLMGKPHFKSVNFTIKCVVGLITLSLIVGTTNVAFDSQVNWGGYHSRYIYEFINHFIGGIGSVLLCVFMVVLFASICMRDFIIYVQKKHKARKARKQMEAALRAEEEAREAALRKDRQTEHIDDIKAGETVEIKSETTDSTIVDTAMNFHDNAAPLYALDDLDDPIDDIPASAYMPQSRPANEEFKAPAATAEGGNGLNEAEQQPASEQIQEEAQNIATSGAEESASGDSESQMVVTVNQIGESKKTLISSREEFESKSRYKFPPINLLREGITKISVDAEEQVENKAKIEQTLLSFGIPITKISATVGPTVTLYEIVPDSGVKIAKIRSLVDDIALSLSAKGVRIIAPIPGRGTVGIEVANKDAVTVSMQTVIKSKKYQESKCILPVALGSTIQNEVYIADLAKMPHLLVAGATGQGKSVGLNAIIASLLYCKSPSELKFVMIDPKQVEFSLYNKLKNYYMAVIPEDEDSSEPVITDMQKVEATLNSLCVEMDNRYTLLKSAQCRNLEEYNGKIKDGKLNPLEGHRFLPYIVVVVDEFGDLIMVSGKNVETPIARLAQKARAVGMHVIIATQRPSTNVITGIIKANFPARISFKVTSGVDSKTILDTPGAQHLIGRGDMLIFNNSEMVRVQCAFIDTPEVEAICDYVSRQPYPQGVYLLPEPTIAGEEGGASTGPVGDRDPLFEEVARRVVSSNTASTSSLQRVYSIGYNRAGKIMDQLEACGIVGPSQGGKPRSVLVDIQGLETILASI